MYLKESSSISSISPDLISNNSLFYSNQKTSKGNQFERYFKFLLSTMEFAVFSVTKQLFFLGLLLFLSVCAEEEEPNLIHLYINGVYMPKPLLPNLQTRLSFPMKDITEAKIEGEFIPRSTTCTLWSDKDFTHASFSPHSDLESTFPNANRLFCYDSFKGGYYPIMVEDMSGNRKLVTVGDCNDYYCMAKLKMPLDVHRAITLFRGMDCEFRSRTSFSETFNYEVVSEPFKGAIEIYCRY